MRVEHGNSIAEITSHISKGTETHDADARRSRLEERIQALVFFLELSAFLGDPLHFLDMCKEHIFEVCAFNSCHQFLIAALHARYAVNLVNNQKQKHNAQN